MSLARLGQNKTLYSKNHSAETKVLISEAHKGKKKITNY